MPNTFPKQPKSKAQVKAIFGLAHKRGFEEEDLRDLCEQEFGSRKISTLGFLQANHLIQKLGGEPLAAPDASGLSRSAVNYHRQKSGVQQLPTQTQIAWMNKLARERGITEEGLQKLCLRITTHTRPHTVKECSKIIEALKAMNARDKANRQAAALAALSPKEAA